MKAMMIYNKARRGFNLTEMAIVLGVISIIIGGIWAAAGAVGKDVKQEQFSEQLFNMVKNIRGAYMGKATVEDTRVAVVMPKLAQMKVFAGDSTRVVGGVTVVDTPFGQLPNPISAGSAYDSIYVCGWKTATAQAQTNCEFTGAGTPNVPLLAVEVLLPSGDTCIKAVMRNSSPATAPGLIDVVINGNKIANLGNPLPVPAALARQFCVPKAAGSDAVVVDFLYRITP